MKVEQEKKINNETHTHKHSNTIYPFSPYRIGLNNSLMTFQRP